MNEHRLRGCRPEPLGSYLKALGVLRMVAEQVDPDATGYWQGETFVLRTKLDHDELVEFFLNDYRPTPLVAPWNGRSGFFRNRKRPSEQVLDGLETSTNPRLALYRETVKAGRAVFDSALRMSWDPKRDKARWIEACRAAFPDECVRWVDAVAVLGVFEGAGESRRRTLAFPPALGASGGVLGSMDLSSNFIARLQVVLGFDGDPDPRPGQVRKWLEASLFGGRVAPLLEESAAQFAPGDVGFGGSSPTGDEAPLLNPWDFILLLEGSLLLASGTARRLDAIASGRSAIPFTVAAVSPLLGSETETEGRSETWVPMWSRPATLAELDRLFGEGRAEWNRRQVRGGLDFAQSVVSLGVDRGIDMFVRYAFVERMGQATAAVPVDRLRVLQRCDIAVTAALDPWLSRIRRANNQPTSVESAMGSVDVCLYRLAKQVRPQRFQEFLLAVARLEIAIGRSSKFRSEAGINPISGLRASEWMAHLADGSNELRVAAALASQHDDDGSRLRLVLRPIQESAPFRGATWSDAPPTVTGIEHADLCGVLAQALVRRSIEVTGSNSAHADEIVGVQTAYNWRFWAPVASVAAFVRGALDDERVRDLLVTLMLFDWRGRVALGSSESPRGGVGHVPPAWAVLAPFFHGRPLEREGQASLILRPERSWPRQITSGLTDRVIAAALRRLQMVRLDPAIADSRVAARNAPRGPRLASALLCPLSDRGAHALLNRATFRNPSAEEGAS